MNKQPTWIVFEGTEGSGKSTQISLLESYANKKGLRVLSTREPGGSALSEEIRTLLLQKHKLSMCKEAEMFLMQAARVQHVKERIMQAQDYDLIICDRFHYSTSAYQGAGRGLDQNIIDVCNLQASLGQQPDVVVFLSIAPEKSLQRAKERSQGESQDRFESEGLDFHQRVHSAYMHMAEKNPELFAVVNADQAIEQVHAEVCRALKDKGMMP